MEPRLPAALGQLTRMQRVSVVLVHAMGYSSTEVGELLGLSRNTIQQHVNRGLARLRTEMGVSLHG